MTKSQADKIAAKLEKSIAAGATGDVAKQNGRALAAIALGDRLPDQGDAVLKGIVRDWWRGSVVKDIRSIPREQMYLLYEMMHAVRDNLKIEHCANRRSRVFSRRCSDMVIHLRGALPESV